MRRKARLLPFRRQRSRRHLRWLEGGIILAAVFAVAVILRPGPDDAQAGVAVADPVSLTQIRGPARVTDGDTLRIGETRVRLHGVDAFERGQICQRAGGQWACGTAATQAMRALVEGRNLVCTVEDIDRYGRSVAVCQRDGADIARPLVAAGLALAYRRYSRAYIADERAAQAARAGAWAGSFDRPEQWRHKGEAELS